MFPNTEGAIIKWFKNQKEKKVVVNYNVLIFEKIRKSAQLPKTRNFEKGIMPLFGYIKLKWVRQYFGWLWFQESNF